MSNPNNPAPGSITWMDLTVDDADRIRGFYAAVAGWTPDPVEMGGYQDFVMKDTEGQPAAGICFKRGVNAGLPSNWILYINVADLEASLARCREGGGDVLVGPKALGDRGRYALIRDPAGAIAGLFQAAQG